MVEDQHNKYSLQERNILGILYSAEKPLTTEAIARRCGISRITAKKYLQILIIKKVLKSRKLSRGIYWWIATNKEGLTEEVKKPKKKLAYA
ncbi:MAG: HTH domain-containing protein [Candidatus Parvarchaeum sp.]